MSDSYIQPTYSVCNRAYRFIWGVVWLVFFRLSPKPFHRWRIFLLRLFGSKFGKQCAVYPSVKIWAPNKLICEDVVAIADGVEIYNPDFVYLKSHAIISQRAYLCGAGHDYNNMSFPLVTAPILIERYVWICARAIVMKGVVVNEGAVLALASLATKDIPAWTVYGGIPAKKIANRERD